MATIQSLNKENKEKNKNNKKILTNMLLNINQSQKLYCFIVLQTQI
jgi:hypothetical protein